MNKPINKPLDDYETKVATDFIKRVTPLPNMEYKILESIWESRIIPTCTINLIIFDKGLLEIAFNELWPKIYLLKRNDTYMPKCWHYPGGYLGADEKINNAIQRIAKREIGSEVTNIILAFTAFMPNFARDPQVSPHFFCKPKNELPNSEKARFFYLNGLPKNLPEHQMLASERIKQLIEFMRLLVNRGLLKNFLEMNQTYELLSQE